MVKYPFKNLSQGQDTLRHQHFSPRAHLKFEASLGQVRRKLWDLSTYLHCSVIGTCLTVHELRRIVVKAAGSIAETWSDHDIHTEGARLASRNDALGKLLNKSLDTRHAAILRKFTPAKNGQDILALWKAAKAEGDIPGGYATVLPRFAAIDSKLSTSGPLFSILDGTVPGQMMLQTARHQILMNNRSATPTTGPTLQLYQDGEPFSLTVNGDDVDTNAYVLNYGPTARVTGLRVSPGGGFVNDVARNARNGQAQDFLNPAKGASGFYTLGLSPAVVLEAGRAMAPLQPFANGPAVNLEGVTSCADATAAGCGL